jgi:hypothetical protein
MIIHYQILTIGEPEAFRCISRIGEHKGEFDTLTIYLDRVPEEFRKAVMILVSPYSNARVVDIDGTVGMGEMHNALLRDVPDGEWSVHLDADEWVPDGFCDAIRQECRFADIDQSTVIGLPRVNFLYEGSAIKCFLPDDMSRRTFISYPDHQWRVVKSGAGVHYVNPIHQYPENAKFRKAEIDSLHIIHHKRKESYEVTIPRWKQAEELIKQRYGKPG